MRYRVFGRRPTCAGAWASSAGALAIVVAALAVAGLGARAATPLGNWQVVLAAGDNAEPVFDDATRALAGRLAAAGVPAKNIHRLSADPADLRRGVEPATVENVLRRIAELPVRPGGRCFIFLTSHGERGAGLWLARSHRALAPAELAQSPVGPLRGGADGGRRFGLLHRRLCRRRDGQAQPDHPDRGAARPALLRLPGRADLCRLRSMPARRSAESGRLAGGFWPDQKLRQPNGARAGRAAIRTAGLFRPGGRRSERRLLNVARAGSAAAFALEMTRLAPGATRARAQCDTTIGTSPRRAVTVTATSSP